MDKFKLKEALKTMEHKLIEQAEVDYKEYLSSNRIDADQKIDDDDTSHLHQSAEVSNQLDHQIHEHKAHLRVIEEIDFSPAAEVRPGAVVKANNRYFVIAVPKPVFKFDDQTFVGISTAAPIYACMEGKKAGDLCSFNNMEFEIQEVL